ncbi:PE family protein [Mycobacterium sp. TY815]|uniref:PE family protein n=1 Tax=Mycobacterium sp. TY815 TaxID=3050581 RepID=UPI002740BEC1|nr:PE family protein [Mycobacterium sp. TY815]MDP7702361.1 PE family protein [Mycobacterium sp. TY815]
MSVFIAPEWVQSAAQELSGIRSTIEQAAKSIAGSTTSISPAAADEVSAAVAAMFGDLGREFQTLSAQTHAFHAEFVKTLNSSVSAYLGAEIANAQKTLASLVPAAAAASAASILDGLTGSVGNLGGLLGGSGSLLSGLGTFPSLQSLLPGIFGATPGPTPPSLAAITGPYEAFVSNTITNLQSLGTGLATNPFPFLHQFITNQSNYGQIITSAFSNAAQHLNNGAAATQILADVAPIASIPGRIGQNAVNLLATVTDFSYSVGVNLTDPLQIGAAFFGMPIALGIDAIGSPVTTANAIASVGAAFSSAVQSGDGFGAAVAVLTSPAVVANGFLNGQYTLGVTLPGVPLPVLGGLPAITVPLHASIALGGILTPLSTVTVNIDPLPGSPIVSVPMGGTPTGGILPGLLLYAPQQLAQAIGAPPLPSPLLPLPQITVPGLPSLGSLLPGLSLPTLPGLTGSPLPPLLGGLL